MTVLFVARRGIDLRLRAPEEIIMSWLHLIGLVITLAVLVYLVVALLKPESFS